MRIGLRLLALCLALVRVSAHDNPDDKCPKDEIACQDVINSSQCIEQLVIEHSGPLTKEAMLKCVETEGSASNLPGAVRVSIGMKGSIAMPLKLG